MLLRPHQKQFVERSVAALGEHGNTLECRHDFGLTRYRASALMTFGFNKREIRQLVDRASPDIGRAA